MQARNIKVGIFVLAGMLFSALVIFLIGDERRLFSSSVEFKTKFSDVQGLKTGAPIRMGVHDLPDRHACLLRSANGGDGQGVPRIWLEPKRHLL